jgi:hypothetical protein
MNNGNGSILNFYRFKMVGLMNQAPTGEIKYLHKMNQASTDYNPLLNVKFI